MAGSMVVKDGERRMEEMADIIAFRGSIAIVSEEARTREELENFLPKLSVPTGLVQIRADARRNFLWFDPMSLRTLGRIALGIVKSAAFDAGEEWKETMHGIDSLPNLFISLGLTPAQA